MTVTSNTAQSPMLPNQRTFPIDPQFLQRELNNSYVSIAESVNARDIAIYSQSPTATGQRFDFIPDSRTQEAKRRVVTFGAVPANAVAVLRPHFLTGFTTFTRIYGVGQTTNDWRPLPFTSVVAVTDQISLLVDRTNVIITNGATGVALISAIVVVEFI